ncbi:6-phospho-3-hexuloisomerase [Candidatus Methylopumilus rimovensis]|jgi:6-phospho-3-hexuloisomerase|uniref:SIS domain-containing protein n=1 Tax=Candidatus Methylopumilus rimovensis TaxID=2588535 RepID=A0AAE6FSN4_9PROT|nr:6-phospho-3-hexuloisomerase [Candidatus Methylopumilus rimovensis]QDD12123.1 SIS domain-containing protein [Candidatus Methylopumilus rimovensis]QDD13430.1 SIS domain-containing protein [Candidatus Methylopumilus rimovensis]
MHQKLLLDKISSVLSVTEQSNAAKLLKLVDEAGRIFVGGAGRSGLVSRFFAMRLVHSGYQVNMVGEIVTPAIKSGDLFLVISGSGGTKTLLPLLETAKSKGAKIVVISMKNKSPMSDMADLTIQIGNDDSFGLTKGMPMGTTFELSTLIYLEAVISELIHAKGLTEEGMRAIHANLE